MADLHPEQRAALEAAREVMLARIDKLRVCIARDRLIAKAEEAEHCNKISRGTIPFGRAAHLRQLAEQIGGDDGS